MSLELNYEINMLRVMVDDSLRRMEQTEDQDRQLKYFNAALAAMQRLLTAVRAHKASAAEAEPGVDEFQKTLEEVQRELGLRGFE